MNIITTSNLIIGEEKLRILETKIIESKTIFSKNPNNPNVVSKPRLHPISFLSVKTTRNAFESTLRTNQHSFCFDRKYVKIHDTSKYRSEILYLQCSNLYQRINIRFLQVQQSPNITNIPLDSRNVRKTLLVNDIDGEHIF